MYCVHIGYLCCADYCGNIEVAVTALGLPYADCFIGKTHMQGVSVCFGIYRYSADAHFFTGADDAKSYFSAIGYQDF
jgi:hypothetical protein